jgi:hypothetical protein
MQQKVVMNLVAALPRCASAFNPSTPGQKIQLSARQPPAHFNPMTQPATPLLSEPGQTRILKIICILVCVLSVSCVHSGEDSPPALLSTNAPPQTISPKMTQQSKSNETERAAALREAFQYAAKQAEDRAHGVPLPPSQFPFPNYDAGPLRPPPILVNVYCMNDHYPDYLLCQYDVDEKNYDRSNEPKSFKAALKQVRHSGPKEFPPIKWVAIIIYNRGDYKDENTTFEQCTKVGAIFKASDVFDSSHDLSQMIAAAAMDRHPFKYDTTQPTPGEQQRWIIVEQHAATNLPTAGSK